MMSFKEFFYRRLLCESTDKLLLEFKVYRLIPGTKNSYRQDSANTNTLTQQHSHVFARPRGSGKQLYAVNFDGSGHDGSSGTCISDVHADYFRGQGYSIRHDNILESLSSTDMESSDYSLLILDDTPPNDTERFLSLFNEHGND